MQRKLIIGDAERGKIAGILAKARTQIKPLNRVAADAVNVSGNLMPFNGWQKVKRLAADRSMSTIELPQGYWCNFTFEEQMPGLCKHLSISLMDDKHPVSATLPSPEAVGHIAQAFEISESSIVAKWVEEYEPGCYAFNIVALDRSN